MMISGTNLGPYQIVSPIGAGGMGEVYKARDTRLNRVVAIKVLPPQVSSNAESKQRFEREAQTIAALNHPHICVLHDIGSQDGVDYLVMEYLDGETLTDRLRKGPLPLDQALKIAIEISDALDKAHRQGVTHRDLKPSNIMLTKSGSKLLDFGLAKLEQGVVAGSPLSQLATADPLTAQGSILGTLQYMAPEQLEGKAPDSRADVFALAAVVYEMVTGRKAFEGNSQASIIAAILTAQPPLVSAMQPMSPPALDRLVKVCLNKNPDDRLQTMRDVELQLRWIVEDNSDPPRSLSVAAGRNRRERVAWTVSAILLLLLLWGSAIELFYLRRMTGETATVRLFLQPPEKVTFGEVGASGPVTISPDGRRVAFAAIHPDGRQLLWVRPLDSLNAQALPGTEGASQPFWSPDSQFVAFFAQNKLKKVGASGGLPQTICDALQPRGGTWGREGVILFSGNVGRHLYRVSAAGDIPIPLVLNQSNPESVQPYFLPDGHHFLYLGRPANHGIFVASLESSETALVLNVERSNIAYAPSGNGQTGYLLFIRGETLLAAPFDTNLLQVTGEPSPIAEEVGYNTLYARGAFSVSETGVLVYGTGGRGAMTQLIWFDRTGKQLTRLGAPGNYRTPSLSPDGKRIAVDRIDPQTQFPDIWLIEASSGITSRFTFDPNLDIRPIWSPDGSRIIFASARSTPPNLYQKLTSGAGKDELLLKSDVNHQPTDWSSDGRFVAFGRLDPKTQWDLWVLPQFGDRKPISFLQTEFNEHDGQFSPDGQWMAYTSDESGTWEVYVRSFPGGDHKRQISTNGGRQSRWRQDGRELFYIAPDRRLMTVAVTKGSMFETSVPRALFETRTVVQFDVAFPIYYAVSADGQRFIVNTSVEENSVSPVTVVLNWTAQLPR